MKFSIKDFFSKFGHADLVTFTEEILNRKLHFLCSDIYHQDVTTIELKAQLQSLKTYFDKKEDTTLCIPLTGIT